MTELWTQALAAIPEARRTTAEARRLASCLSAFGRISDLAGVAEAWLALDRWLRLGVAGAADAKSMGLTVQHSTRVVLFFSVVESSPEVRSALLDAVARLLAGSDATNLLGATGIPGERGFMAEATERLVNRLIPAPRDEHDLSLMAQRLWPNEAEVQRFAHIPDDLFHRLVLLLTPDDRPGMWHGVRAEFADGFRLLSTRIAAQGLTRKLRERSLPGRVIESPFLRSAQLGETLLAAWEGGQDVTELLTAWRIEAAGCRAALGEIHRQLETDGVSVDIVFGIDVLEHCLTRQEDMVAIMSMPAGSARSAAIHRLLARLALRAWQDRSVRHLAGTNLRLLHRRIVDRAGATGEHYIANDRSEYRHIWLAAAGGGALTVLTAAGKVAIASLHHAIHLAALPTGLLYGGNYALCFIALQHLGLMLATKQPAMTAASLASIMRDHPEADRLEPMVDRMTQICASQLAAAIANVAVVAVGAFAFDGLWRLLTGRHWMTMEMAQKTYTDLSPLDSLTIFYAALTGVILWLSSLAGGWFDNWSAYHRLPQAIAEHRLGARLGRGRMQAFAAFWHQHAAGWGTNISLGMMLGMTPALGEVLGLPMDVRHVTLSTGILSLAVSGLGDSWHHQGFVWYALAGIGVMFVLNLGVSFGLSLLTAARALDMSWRELVALGRRLLVRLVRHPAQFVLPPRS